MAVMVEQVGHRREWRRFLDLPLHLHRGTPGWLPPLASLDRWLLDTQLNATLHDLDVEVLVGRRRGRVVGRIAVHGGEERAVFSHLEAADEEALESLVGAALDTARGWGAREMEGPRAPGDPSDPGLRVDRQDVSPGVGLPWHPARYASALIRLGAAVVEEEVRWRLAVSDVAGGGSNGGGEPMEVPPAFAPWADDRLASQVGVAVPDVVVELGATGVWGSWGAARRAARRGWRSCAVVALLDDPRLAVPALATLARAAGYTEIVSPWGGTAVNGVRFVRVGLPA